MNDIASPATAQSQRVVLDTNAWLDWLVFDDPNARTLVSCVLDGQLVPVQCPPMREELADVLSRPQLQVHADRVRSRRGLPAAPIDVAAALERFDAHTLQAPCAPPCGLVCADPDDQPFIDLAVAAHARWLLTKDRALLALARAARGRHGVHVLTLAAFSALQAPALPTASARPLPEPLP